MTGQPVPVQKQGVSDCAQPPDPEFWTVHVHGPDDVIPFDTEDLAECYAAAIMDLTKPGGPLYPSSPLSPVISAHVIPPADPAVPVQGEADAREGLADRAREIAELYLYNGDVDRPLNDGYGKLLSLADSIDAVLAGSPVHEGETDVPIRRDGCACGRTDEHGPHES